MTLRFVGWGCKGLKANGKEIEDFSMSNFNNLEMMIEKAYANEDVYSLKIFKCYSDWQEIRPNEEPINTTKEDLKEAEE